ncbi:hypothetical protein, partial [Halobacillus trueperi]|uniref:hypothetical protein n=1 Tax=Halobacillus trueperi TaxID=156205 RepID=UPI001ABEF01E
DLERFMSDPALGWKTPHLGIGVRFSPTSNGVVGKLRDSRGNGLTGETPQSEARGDLPSSPQESE